jgi:predicted molibdopterin-dependent oxidoreductase YjgC
VSAEAARQAAAALGAAKNPVIVLGPLALAGAQAKTIADLTIDLLLALGKTDKGLLLSADRCDLVGVMLAGLAPGRLPGLATYETAPSGWPKLPEQPGVGEAGVIEAGATGRLNALLVCGVDPLVHGTNAEALRKAMEVTGFVVVCDSFLTETAKKAHVFLPTMIFAERAGTYITAEGRALRLTPAMTPRDGAWPEWKIVVELAKRLGQAPTFGSLAEIRAAAATAAPILAALGKDGLPPKGAMLPRAPLGEQAKLWFSEPPAAPPRPEGDLVLVAGAVFQHNGSLSSWSPAIAEVCATPWIELHPSDAARRGLHAGDRARIAARGVELHAPVRLNDQLTPGVAFSPRHFAAFPVGRLLGDEPYVAVTAAKQN